jgi:hypothetical protein
MSKIIEIGCCAACPFQGYTGAKPMCFKTKEILDSVDASPPASCPLLDKAGDDKTLLKEMARSRYEKLRQMNPTQFKELWRANISGGWKFDELVDAWPELPSPPEVKP